MRLLVLLSRLPAGAALVPLLLGAPRHLARASVVLRLLPVLPRLFLRLLPVLPSLRPRLLRPVFLSLSPRLLRSLLLSLRPRLLRWLLRILLVVPAS